MILLRSRSNKYNYNCYFIQSDIEKVYKFLDDISGKEDQSLIGVSCKEILNKNNEEFL